MQHLTRWGACLSLLLLCGFCCNWACRASANLRIKILIAALRNDRFGVLMSCNKFFDFIGFEGVSTNLIFWGAILLIFSLASTVVSIRYFKRRESFKSNFISSEVSKGFLSASDSISKLQSAAVCLGVHSKTELRSALIAVDAHLKTVELLILLKSQVYDSTRLHPCIDNRQQASVASEPGGLKKAFRFVCRTLSHLNFWSSNRSANYQINRKLWLAAVGFMVGAIVVFWANIDPRFRPDGETVGQWFERSAAIAAVFSILVSGLMEECITAIKAQVEVSSGKILLKYDGLLFWAHFWKGCALILSIVATLCWGYGSVFHKKICG